MEENLKRIKKYKAKSPEETIHWARNILHQKLGILMEEEHFVSEKNFYSCRIAIGNNNLGYYGLGTNGKGMKFEYSLASAYGEFMERIQNQAIIMGRRVTHKDNKLIPPDSTLRMQLEANDLLLQYKNAPDEKYHIFRKGDTVLREYVRAYNIEEFEDYYDNKEIVLLPYYCVDTDKVEYLPSDIIQGNCTSNGMCAGNTPKEALIQGLSELLERFVVASIYKKNISFPTIPKSYFKGTEIYKKLSVLEERYQWDFQIKDCSCDLGIPAIGVLIIDYKDKKYNFHIGVDPSPITALERSITEIFQGRRTLEMQNIDFKLQNDMLHDTILKDQEYFKTCTIGLGHYPITLLSGKSEFTFKGFNMEWGHSDDQDLEKLVKVFHSLGAKIYIRDVSFLGFPAYTIYSPGFSEFRNVLNNEHFNIYTKQLPEIMVAAMNMDKQDQPAIRLLADFLSENEKRFGQLKIYNTQSHITEYNGNLLLFMLHNYIGNKEQAACFLSEYLEKMEGTFKERNFFDCLYYSLVAESQQDLLNLQIVYGEDMVNQVKKFLAEREFTKYLRCTSCYDCDNCKLKQSCNLMDVAALTKRLENEYIKHTPVQTELSKLFYV